ncbi:NAD(P)H-binding protein [Streptomyces reniochalinae]|uniref:NAD-dependent epimerase/dehydratase family protein n=1 Tax=Streptomyces reniochalinae TaxID=2250578 RepID=A0A367EQ66_9ACTN|nr:NAD(P)H-binding protein [Streptomyces reniochalinae]RCG20234.1 NAD-dependent epimerase/dehydratase family protein [Streptomyces reniochalinae]
MTSQDTHPDARPAVLVIGATGTTGSRVAARLVAEGHHVRAAGRRAAPVHGAQAVRFDWYEPGTHQEALRGADRVYLLPPVGSTEPAAVVRPFLKLARASGVRRAVLLSTSAIAAGGPAVGQVHEMLPSSFDEWAVLRPSWFMQNFTGDHLHAATIRAEGVIRTATGEGRVGFVDAEDIAAVAVRALTDARSPDTDLVLTGPEALSYSDVAHLITEVSGRAVTHSALTYEQMRDHLSAQVPPDFAAALAGMDLAIAEGAEDRTTDTVTRVTGRPARSMRTHLAEAVTPGNKEVRLA